MKSRFSDHCTNTVIETSDTLDKSEVSLGSVFSNCLKMVSGSNPVEPLTTLYLLLETAWETQANTFTKSHLAVACVV